MSVQSAVSAVKRAVVPDPVTSLEARLVDCLADLASTETAKAEALTALAGFEVQGNVRAADDAARAAQVAVERLARGVQRRAAIQAGLHAAKTARAAEEKKAHVEALSAQLASATKSADASAEKAVETLVQLGKDLES